MNFNVYSIYDKVTGLYAEPFLSVNEASAIRKFNSLMLGAPSVANDCQLYFVGQFDNMTGSFIPGFEFVCNFEVKNNG